MARYVTELADYDFTLVHQPGKVNCADHLSQHPGYDTGMHDNQQVTVLPPQLFTRAMAIEGLKTDVATQQEDATEITDWATTWPLELQDGIHYNKG